MNLQDILIDAGAGFVTGLTVGLVGMPEKIEEKLELVKLIPEKERIERGGKLTDKELGKYKNNLRNMKLTLPLVIGGAYSALASLVSQNFVESFGEKWIVSVPSAYLGRFVGSKIRKFKNKEKREDMKLMAQMVQDPENPDKYLLSDGQREKINNAFSEIEKMVLEDREKEIIFDLHKGPVRRIYDAMTESKTKYAGLLLAWSLGKQLDIIKHANLQRDITRFYERSYEVMPPKEFSVADCMIIGEPENPKIKAFTKEGGDFYIQTVELPNLKIIKNDKTRVVGVAGERPTVTSTEREIWTEDYKALTDKFVYERDKEGGYTMMLMQIPSGMPDEMKTNIIMTSFLPAYESYHSKNKRE